MYKLFPMFASAMEEKEKEILTKASEIFSKYGIKSMTMDDVSRQLGISKKTLYQFVENKKDLVKRSIECHIADEECDIMKLLDDTGNAIDQLMSMIKVVGTQMKEMHPSVIYDLKKYHPEAYKCLTNHRDQFIYKNIKRNLEMGIEDGLYRDNINPEIVTRLYLSMVNVIIDPEEKSLSEHSMEAVYLEMIRYHVRGIASAKGRAYLKTKFNQEN